MPSGSNAVKGRQGFQATARPAADLPDLEPADMALAVDPSHCPTSPAPKTRPVAPMASIADMRRALTVGTTVTVSGHRYPDLNGEREVVKAQTNRWSLALPDGHPRQGAVAGGSWLDIPSRDRVRFNDDGSATVLTQVGPGAGDIGELATFTVHRSAD